MPALPLFVNGGYQSQSPLADNERTVNWYPEPIESPGGTVKVALYPTPGVLTAFTTPQSVGKAMFAMGGRAFAVIGAGFYEFYESDTYTLRGTVAENASPATISCNGLSPSGAGGDQLFITAGGKGYTFDLNTNVFTQVVAANCDMGASVYGYFLYLDVASSVFYISNYLDGLTWDPTQYAQRTIGPDPWTSMFVTPYGQIWLLGSQTSEVWYNAGSYPFPFAPDPSGLIPYGCAAQFSTCFAGDTITGLATTRNGGYQVMSARGFTPQRISTYALENAIANYAVVSDAVGATYEDHGHAFYLLTFPTEGVTWCYDFRTQLWHERGTWLPELNAYDAWRPTWHCFAFNKHYWCDRENGSVYEVGDLFTTDVGGGPIRRVRRTPAVFSEHERIRLVHLEIFLETGLGTPTGQGANPQVMLRTSYDGGKTWTSERTSSAGRTGIYNPRVLFWRLGQGRTCVFEVSVTDPIPWRIMDGYMHVKVDAE